MTECHNFLWSNKQNLKKDIMDFLMNNASAHGLAFGRKKSY